MVQVVFSNICSFVISSTLTLTVRTHSPSITLGLLFARASFGSCAEKITILAVSIRFGLEALHAFIAPALIRYLSLAHTGEGIGSILRVFCRCGRPEASSAAAAGLETEAADDTTQAGAFSSGELEDDNEMLKKRNKENEELIRQLEQVVKEAAEAAAEAAAQSAGPPPSVVEGGPITKAARGIEGPIMKVVQRATRKKPLASGRRRYLTKDDKTFLSLKSLCVQPSNVGPAQGIEFRVLPEASPNGKPHDHNKAWAAIPDGFAPVAMDDEDFARVRRAVMKYSWQTQFLAVATTSNEAAMRESGGGGFTLHYAASNWRGQKHGVVYDVAEGYIIPGDHKYKCARDVRILIRRVDGPVGGGAVV